MQMAKMLRATLTDWQPESLEEPDKIIFAERNKRTENLLFRSFYVIYKMLFKLLTGKVITFGNFSLVPQNRLQNLVRVSEIWNNYPGRHHQIPDSLRFRTDQPCKKAGGRKQNELCFAGFAWFKRHFGHGRHNGRAHPDLFHFHVRHCDRVHYFLSFS